MPGTCILLCEVTPLTFRKLKLHTTWQADWKAAVDVGSHFLGELEDLKAKITEIRTAKKYYKTAAADARRLVT